MGHVCGKSCKQVKFYNEKENARIRYLKEEEMVRLLKACPLETRRITFFADSTGARQGEILNLLWKDVDVHGNHIEIRRTKSGRPRYVPMTQLLGKVLQAMPKLSEYVFGKEKGKVPGWSLYRRSFRKAVTDAGIEDFHFHDLRHCFATQLREQGVDLSTLGKLLGHSTVAMTERYAHVGPNHTRVAVGTIKRRRLPHCCHIRIRRGIWRHQNGSKHRR